MSAPVQLSQLLEGLASVTRDALLADLSLDSRQVRSRGAFLACRGASHHGLEYLREVIDRGAAAVLWEPEGVAAPAHVPGSADVVMVAVPGLAARASLIADRFFASPSRALDVIGVTGTNGKTTCAWLLAQALSACGLPSAYMGTLGTAFDGRREAGLLTTPDAVTVQRQLAAFREQGARSVAMEVSSHALAQHRVAAVRFRAAVFTNLTREHLDFHGDMASYGAAKAGLFDHEDLQLRVFNIDDPFGAQLAARPAFADRIACSSRGADVSAGRFVKAVGAHFSRDGLRFTLESSFGVAQVRTGLVGAFNVDNLLAALAVLLGSDVPLQQAVDAVAEVAAPSGRLESFAARARPLVVVDYAHTPDALEQVLRVLRLHCRGRLIAVFGCGGDRDRGKRSQMGAVAARGADKVILTDDNSRTEDPAAIVADILSGMPVHRASVVHDRREAILRAIAMAAPEDVVLVAGKGHEDYQITGNERRPFSDQRVVREALALGGNS